MERDEQSRGEHDPHAARGWRALTTRADVIVAAGAAVGVLLRYAVGRWSGQYLPDVFPFATFAVNIAGCFLIGIVNALFVDAKLLGRSAHLVLATGFCGGFTTFSTFSVETLGLFQRGDVVVALLYQLLSLGGGLLAVAAGLGVGGLVARLGRAAP